MKITKNKKGFTLIELIVVIAILGILAAIAVPRLGGFTESAKETTDQEIAAVVANAAAMDVAQQSTITPVTSEATANTMLNRMATNGLIDSTYISEAAIEGAFKSTKYKGFSLRVTNAGAVTVHLQLTNGTDDAADYIVTK